MSNGMERLLLFSMGENRYALDLREVAEVLSPPATFPVPWAPPCLTGAINFHGALVAVFDLAGFMKVGAPAPDGNLLVLDRGGVNLALLVDRVEQIVPADTILEEEAGSDPLVEKVLILADGAAALLAVGKLLEKVEEAMQR